MTSDELFPVFPVFLGSVEHGVDGELVDAEAEEFGGVVAAAAAGSDLAVGERAVVPAADDRGGVHAEEPRDLAGGEKTGRRVLLTVNGVNGVNGFSRGRSPRA